jgi:hypothetical protein
VRARIEIGPLIGAAGALMLAASLFLHWYKPDLTAFTAFEVLDLVLFALAVMCLAGLLTELGVPVPWGEAVGGVVPLMAGVALVLVVSQAINHPPAATGHGAASGLWVGLAGAGLLASGAGLSVTQFSLGVNLASARGSRQLRALRAEASAPAPPAPPRRRRSPAAESRETENDVMGELYPEGERVGPIGSNDPVLGRPDPEEGS